MDPSGSYFAWKATAIGKNMINAKTFLEKRYAEDMDIEDAIHTAILTLKEGYEGSLDEHGLEIGVITERPFFNKLNGRTEPGFRQLTPAEIKDYLVNIA